MAYEEVINIIRTSEAGGNWKKRMDGKEEWREQVKVLQTELKTKEDLRMFLEQQLVKERNSWGKKGLYRLRLDGGN